MKDSLIAKAKEQVKQYPQYDKLFDNCVVVKIRKNIKTKMGLAFEKDEITLAEPSVRSFIDLNGKRRTMMTVWSYKNRIHTSINAKDVVIIND